METFGDYLKRLRLEKRLTLMEVREHSGISIAYLSQVEQGKRPPPHPNFLRKLASIYEVPLQEILERAGFLKEEKPQVFSEADELEWAFQAILRDPSIGPFIDKGRARFMPMKAKIAFVKNYEKMSGRKLLKWKKRT
jgi:transcriptional regulator with XRE-family HTH domain